MILNNLEILGLSPEWHFRLDNGSGIVYKFSLDECKYIRLSPYETVTLILCDGHRRIGEIVELLTKMLELDKESAKDKIRSLLNKDDHQDSFIIHLSEPKDGLIFCNIPKTLQVLATENFIQPNIRRLQYPLSLLLIPTYTCQTNCIYCYAERPPLSPKKYMAKERWIELLSEVGEAGLDLITFSGGDPLTYPEIDQLMSVMDRYHMNWLTPTKSLITPQRAEQLSRYIYGKRYVQVSIDSFDPKIAELMTRTPNYSVRARTSITNLVAAGIPVRTNTVVTPFNLHTIDQLIRELKDLGVHRAHITNYARSYYCHQDSLFLDSSQIELLNLIVQKNKQELNWTELQCNAAIIDYSQSEIRSSEAWKNRTSCSGGFSSCVILPDGDVVLCEQVPHDERFVVGNVKNRSLLDIWNSMEIINFIVPDKNLFFGTACGNCAEFDICHRIFGRCFRDAYFNYNRIYAPSPRCPQATPGIRIA